MSKKLQCECCKRFTSKMMVTSAYLNNVKIKTRIHCPPCHMAITLSMFQLAKKADPKEAEIIQEIANALAKINEDLSEELWRKAKKEVR